MSEELHPALKSVLCARCGELLPAQEHRLLGVAYFCAKCAEWQCEVMRYPEWPFDDDEIAEIEAITTPIWAEMRKERKMTTDRQQAIDFVTAMGARVCGYVGGEWPDRRCDCKFGGPGKGEKTGCPELRVLLKALQTMTDEQWQEFSKRD